jgi:hypothetical protein
VTTTASFWVAHNKTRGLLLDRPRAREAAGHLEHGYARGAERAIVSTMARGIARLGKPCAAPAAWRCSLRFFAPRRASGFWMVDLQDFSAELFLERAGLVRIGKTPSKIDLALSDNSPPVPHLNLSTRVKGCNPAAQIDI